MGGSFLKKKKKNQQIQYKSTAYKLKEPGICTFQQKIFQISFENALLMKTLG